MVVECNVYDYYVTAKLNCLFADWSFGLMVWIGDMDWGLRFGLRLGRGTGITDWGSGLENEIRFE